jgi:hypothetical protein
MTLIQGVIEGLSEGKKTSVRNPNDCTNAQAGPGQYIHMKALALLRTEVFLQRV